MINILTTYYKRLENFAGEMSNAVIVQVSNSKPKWFPWDCLSYKALMPDWDCVAALKNGSISEEEFTRRYKNKLNKLDRQTVLEELQYKAESEGANTVYLVCWEASNKFCHRHILAEWLDCGVEELY